MDSTGSHFCFGCRTFSFSDKTEMFCFMGSLSAEKQIEKTSEQGSLLGSAHCVCSTDSLRDIPTDTDFGSTVRTDMPGVSPGCMWEEQQWETGG